MEKEILVIFTGGTISSRIQADSTIGVTENAVWQLLEDYKNSGAAPVKFSVLQPFTMLSENCIPKNWQMLLEVLDGIDFERYRGVIITHGTDTLSYTAALLGYLFGHLQIPMVLIGSNYPLEDVRSNGRANFFAAVRLIREDRWKGVFVAFQSKEGKNHIYLPTRLNEADSYTDEFSSFGGMPLGEMTENGLCLYESPINPSEEELMRERMPAVECMPEIKNNILMIQPYPGMDYEMFSLKKKPAAVLHGLYHSATACTVGDFYSAGRFVERCKKEGIPVYVFSVKPGEKQYETGNALLKTGARPLYNMAAPAAYMKLLAAYAQKQEEPEKWLEKQYYFENVPG